jgi:hypothetical protein
MAGGKLISTGVEFPDATTQTTSALPLTGGTMTGTIAGFTSTGIDDNATSTAISIDASENVYLRSTNPSLNVGTSNVSTGNCALNIGQDRTGDGYSFIDLIGDTTYSDFGTRLIRNNNGLNANSTLQHRGTGELQITATEAAPIVFSTNGTEGMRLLSGGGLTFNGDTAAANALDDYEEGTFTVTISSAVGTLGLGATTDRLSYTKIGRVVQFQGYVNNNTFSGASGAVDLTGFPFAVSDLAEFSERPAILISVTGSTDNGAKAGIMAGAWTQVTILNFDASALDTDTDLYISGSYITG